MLKINQTCINKNKSKCRRTFSHTYEQISRLVLRNCSLSLSILCAHSPVLIPLILDITHALLPTNASRDEIKKRDRVAFFFHFYSIFPIPFVCSKPPCGADDGRRSSLILLKLNNLDISSGLHAPRSFLLWFSRCRRGCL